MGRATALDFAKEGAKGIVLVSRTKENLEKVAKEIAEINADVKTAIVAGDTSLEATAKDMVEAAQKEFGQVDVAFVNAGTFGEMAPFKDVKEESYDFIMNANVKSVVFAFKYLMPAMKESPTKDTSIVVNTSCMGSVARASFAGAGIYAASKAAADMLVKYAAIEGAEQSTRVNAVAPGIMHTNIMPMDQENYDKFAGDKQLVGRAGRDYEIAKVVTFLASEDATFVTGTVQVADGGWALKAP